MSMCKVIRAVAYLDNFIFNLQDTENSGAVWQIRKDYLYTLLHRGVKLPDIENEGIF